MSQLQNLKLHDGSEIPVLGYGLGTAQYKSNDDGTIDKKIIDTTVMAINAGYYHLDGAQGMYIHSFIRSFVHPPIHPIHHVF